MAVQVIQRKTCDRCQKVLEEKETLDDPANASPARLVLECTLHGVSVGVQFSDLCPECEKRAADLVTQLRQGRRRGSEDDGAEAGAAEDGKPKTKPDDKAPASGDTGTPTTGAGAGHKRK